MPLPLKGTGKELLYPLGLVMEKCNSWVHLAISNSDLIEIGSGMDHIGSMLVCLHFLRSIWKTKECFPIPPFPHFPAGKHSIRNNLINDLNKFHICINKLWNHASRLWQDVWTSEHEWGSRMEGEDYQYR